jgi:phosphotransferase system HPr (HPr) family protein
MKKEIITIQNVSGLHGRPAALFVQEAKKFTSSISVRNADKDGECVNAKSVIRLLSASLSQGTAIEIVAEGQDEDEAIAALITLIEEGFGEL